MLYGGEENRCEPNGLGSIGAHIEVRITKEYTIYSKTSEDFVKDYTVFGGYMVNRLELGTRQ